MTRASTPSAASDFGSAPTTSARPPVLLSGAHSAAAIKTAGSRSSLLNLVPDEDGTAYKAEEPGLAEIDPDNMPYFKQIRLRLTNRLLRDNSNSEDKKKFGFRKKKTAENAQTTESQNQTESDLTKAIESQTTPQLS